MKILVTGVNGFIGQHLSRELIKRGHKVIGISRSKKCKVEKIHEYHIGSVLNRNLIKKIVTNVDIVVHLAALTSHEDIVSRRSTALKTNLLGTKNVLDAFTNSKITKKFMYASTGKVYGEILYLPITEAHPTKPLNILGKSKLEVEKLINSYNENKKELIIFRVFNIYGPMQSKNFLISTIFSQLLRGKREVVLGDIETRRDFVYIDDLVYAFVLAIEGKNTLGVSVYNICTGIGSSASKIVNLISSIKGVKIKIKVNPSLIRTDEMREEYGSFDLVKKQLGWKPKIKLEEGLKKIIN